MMATLAKCTSIQEPCAASYARQNPVWAPMPPWDPTLTGSRPPPLPSPWFAPWARSGWGRRVNCEWGRPTARANKSTEQLFSRANAKRRTAGGSHEYLIEKEWEKLEEGGARGSEGSRQRDEGWGWGVVAKENQQMESYWERVWREKKKQKYWEVK